MTCRPARHVARLAVAALLALPGLASASAVTFDFNTFTYIDDPGFLFGGGTTVSADGSTVDLMEDPVIPIVTVASYDVLLFDFNVGPTFEVMAGDVLSFDWSLELPADNVDGLSVVLFDSEDVTVLNAPPFPSEVFFMDAAGSGTASIGLDAFGLTGLTVGFDISLISDPLFTTLDLDVTSSASVSNLTLTRAMTGGGGGGTTVPEPGALLLCLLALGLLVNRRSVSLRG